LDLINLPEFFTKKWYIFSGILGTQAERFVTALKATPLESLVILDENYILSAVSNLTPAPC
jgi:hypothetical protein